MTETAANVFRDYNTAGVPESGDYDPEKILIRAWGAQLEAAVNGDPAGRKYSFDGASQADSDPGAGKFRLNHAVPASATAAYVDNVDALGLTATGELDSWDSSSSTVKGRLRVVKVGAASVFRLYDVSGSVVDGTGYRKLTLTHVEGAGSLATDDLFVLQFTPSGDKGETGATGNIDSSNATVTDIIKITQAAYDALDPPVETTLYIIID